MPFHPVILAAITELKRREAPRPAWARCALQALDLPTTEAGADRLMGGETPSPHMLKHLNDIKPHRVADRVHRWLKGANLNPKRDRVPYGSLKAAREAKVIVPKPPAPEARPPLERLFEIAHDRSDFDQRHVVAAMLRIDVDNLDAWEKGKWTPPEEVQRRLDFYNKYPDVALQDTGKARAVMRHEAILSYRYRRWAAYWLDYSVGTPHKKWRVVFQPGAARIFPGNKIALVITERGKELLSYTSAQLDCQNQRSHFAQSKSGINLRIKVGPAVCEALTEYQYRHGLGTLAAAVSMMALSWAKANGITIPGADTPIPPEPPEGGDETHAPVDTRS